MSTTISSVGAASAGAIEAVCLGQATSKSPSAQALRSPFDSIPNEVIGRIFAIGADVAPKTFPMQSTMPKVFYNQPDYEDLPCKQGPGLFASVASLVCRRWYAVTRIKSYIPHLWISPAIFRAGKRKDMAIALTRFKQMLDNSVGCDLYIFMEMPGYLLEADDPLCCFRIMAAAFKVLEKFKPQLVSLEFNWQDINSLPFIWSLLQAFRDSPRLAALILDRRDLFQAAGPSLSDEPALVAAYEYKWDLQLLYGRSDHFLESAAPWSVGDLVLNPGCSMIYLSFQHLNIWMAIASAAIRTLWLGRWGTASDPGTWLNVLNFLRDCPNLAELSIDLRFIEHSEALESWDEDFPNPLTTRIQTLNVGLLPATINPLFVDTKHPDLHTLSTYLIDDVDNTNPSDNIILDATIDLPSLSTMRCFSHETSKHSDDLILARLKQASQISHLHIDNMLPDWVDSKRVFRRNLQDIQTDGSHAMWARHHPRISPVSVMIDEPQVNDYIQQVFEFPGHLLRFDMSRIRSMDIRFAGAGRGETSTETTCKLAVPELDTITVSVWRTAVSRSIDYSENWDLLFRVLEHFLAPKLKVARLLDFYTGPERISIEFNVPDSQTSSPSPRGLALSFPSNKRISVPNIAQDIFRYHMLTELKSIIILVHGSREASNAIFTLLELVRHHLSDDGKELAVVCLPMLRVLKFIYTYRANDEDLVDTQILLSEVVSIRSLCGRPLEECQLTGGDGRIIDLDDEFFGRDGW